MDKLFIAAIKDETFGIDYFKHIGVGKINATYNTLRLINIYKPKIIIRTGIGSQSPLHPQYQHIGDFSEAIAKMCTTIEVIKLKEPKDIFPAYKKAYERKDGKNTIVVEYGDYYSTK